MRCHDHDHPQLDEPISESLFRAECAAILLCAGIPESEVRKCQIVFPAELGKRHEADPRAYADVQCERRLFRFAPQALALPEANRLGLIAHEIGHLLDPAATENGADAASEGALGVKIAYDSRWPGKGLQRLERIGKQKIGRRT